MIVSIKRTEDTTDGEAAVLLQPNLYQFDELTNLCDVAIEVQVLRFTDEFKRTMFLVVDDNSLLGSKKMLVLHFKLFFLLEDLIVANFTTHITSDFIAFLIILDLQFQLRNRPGLLLSLL